ncbi:MAG: glycosyltransferase family 2 protein [Phocaeicola sp.]
MNNLPISPRFSIITVTYNAEKVLERTLKSIAVQTYTQIESIVIDGNSIDGTLSLVRQYEKVVSLLVSEPDNGIYDAMNKGLERATGDYICFLNAGDTFHSADTLQCMVDSLASQSADSSNLQVLPDIVYGQTAIVDDAGIFLHMRRLQAPKNLTWKSFQQGMLVCHQAFFVKRTLAQKEPYNLTYRFSADFDWCIRLMKQAKELHFTHLTLVNYLNEGMTTQNHKASLKERFQIMCRHYGVVSTVLHHAWFVVRLIMKR